MSGDTAGLTPELARALKLAAALGEWAAAGGRTESATWAARAAEQLAGAVHRHVEAAAHRRLWAEPGRPFARTAGYRLHTRDCVYVTPAAVWHEPLTRAEAAAYLRKSHDHRRCRACVPDIPEAPWARVVSPRGVVRWRLDGAEPGAAG